jgi:hypothetical protein
MKFRLVSVGEDVVLFSHAYHREHVRALSLKERVSCSGSSLNHFSACLVSGLLDRLMQTHHRLMLRHFRDLVDFG